MSCAPTHTEDLALAATVPAFAQESRSPVSVRQAAARPAPRRHLLVIAGAGLAGVALGAAITWANVTFRGNGAGPAARLSHAPVANVFVPTRP